MSISRCIPFFLSLSLLILFPPGNGTPASGVNAAGTEGRESREGISAGTNPLIEAMVDSVSEDRLRETLETLAGFRTRHTTSDTVSDTLGIGAARRWIHGKYQELSGSGIQALYFDFEEEICGTYGQHRNVLGTLPGTMPESSDRIFLVLGHMDTRNENLCDSTDFAPGTNDDGSGTAAGIELARVMSRYDFDATLAFSAVTGEEQGLFGSTAYAEYARQNDLRIDGVINNDMIGNIRGDDGALDSTTVRHFSVGPSTSPSRQLARYMKLKGEQYVPDMTVTLIPAQDRPGRSGDHVPFNQNGYAAARLIETNEAFEHQHSGDDLLEFMNIPYMARIVRINVAGLASLALAPATPTGLEIRDVGNGTDLSLSWPAVNTEPDFAGYRAAVRMADSLFYDRIVDMGDTNEYTLTGLTDGEAVYISISGLDDDANESIFSAEVLATPRSLPAPPAGLESTSQPDIIQLRWEPNTELDLRGYNIYRSTTSGTGFIQVGSVEAPGTAWADGTAETGVLYYYRIRAVDEDLQESDFSSEVRGRLASHHAGILIFDATLDGNGAPLQPTDEQVDAFYEGILDPYRVAADWDRADSVSSGLFVSDADMSIYSTVVWHTDRLNGASHQDTTQLRKYLAAGGRLLLIGWNLAKTMTGSFGLFHEFPPGTFMHDYAKLDSIRTTSTADTDFSGADGLAGGYPDMAIDTLKVTVVEGLYNIDLLLEPFVDEPVTEAVYGYRSSEGGASPYHGLPVGLRHISDELKIVVFDFPLFFMDSVSAAGAMAQAMDDLGEVPVGIDDDEPPGPPGLPQTYSLTQNYPNPFNPATKITYALPRAGKVTLTIYDLHGRKVRVLADGEKEAGYHTMHWDGRDDSGRRVSSGIFFYRIRTDGFSKTRKMLLIE